MFPFLGLLALLFMDAQSITPQATYRSIPFDTTLVVAATPTVSIDLETGGAIRIVGGTSKVLRVHVSEPGRLCTDCGVAVTHTATGVQVRTRRSPSNRSRANVQVEIEVPVQCNVELSSAGGAVEIEGIDGTLSGITQAGELNLRRISGAVELQTRHGDITLRESYVSGMLRTLEGRVLFEDVGGRVEGESAKGRVIKRRVERSSGR
jgi:DUF4097 and DUF4098 domain-containing protein YvlB